MLHDVTSAQVQQQSPVATLVHVLTSWAAIGGEPRIGRSEDDKARRLEEDAQRAYKGRMHAARRAEML